MASGISRNVKMILGWLSDETKLALNCFCAECLGREYEKFDNLDDAAAVLGLLNASFANKETLRRYSGLSYFNLNSAARGTWNYHDNGHIDGKAEYDAKVDELKDVIKSCGSSAGNVKVYRGVPVDYFREYGISSLEELSSLRGNYLYDMGFVSTSVTEDRCFYRSDPKNGVKYNVMVEYLIPEEFTDGVFMVNASNYVKEGEYLINACNLAYVSDVEMDGDSGAIVRAVLVPQNVYDCYYQQSAVVGVQK